MSLSDHPLFYPVLNLIGVLVMLTINALANISQLNGYTTGELSAQYPNRFVPPGWVFSIWGIIYLLNLVFVTWTFVNRTAHEELISQIGWWFIIVSLLNAIWLVLWHYEQVWTSTLIMILLLFSLIRIHIILQNTEISGTIFDTMALQANFGVYLGWIAVATVANITAGLVQINWNGWGISEEIWTAIMIVVVLVLTLFMVINQHSIWFGLVIIWAVGGIFLNQQDISVIALPAAITVLGTISAVLYELLLN